jgi:hypothetical protein
MHPQSNESLEYQVGAFVVILAKAVAVFLLGMLTTALFVLGMNQLGEVFGSRQAAGGAFILVLLAILVVSCVIGTFRLRR